MIITIVWVKPTIIMPLYDYFCEANQTVVPVRHSIMETLDTWGEVRSRSGHPPGNTTPSTPVMRLLAGGMIITSTRKGISSGGSCCGEQGCGPAH